MTRGHDIAMHLRSAYLTLHRRAQNHFAEFGVTADQYVILTLLAQKDGVKQQDLVERSSSDPNTVSAILLLLEQRGLITRHEHKEDRRARAVRLTAEGRSLQQRLMEHAKQLHDVISAAVSEEDFEYVIGCLERISSVMARTQ